MTDTEKLREEIVKLIHIKWTPPSIDKALANQVLKVRKEAGLKFVPDEWALPLNPHFARSEEHPLPIFRGYAQAKIEIPKAINSQIKEIEIARP